MDDPVSFYRARHQRKHTKRVVVVKPRSGPLTQTDMDSLICTWDDLLFETPSGPQTWRGLTAQAKKIRRPFERRQGSGGD